jgi:endonuclease YncB( thermonuclease family)
MTRALTLSIVLWLAAAVAASAQEVSRVVNGETIEVAGVGKVQLIGIDARESALRVGRSGPATPPRSGPDTPPPPLITGSVGVKPDNLSRDGLARLVLGKRVRLEYDEAANKGRGTRRAYVFLEDDTLVNAEMLRAGFARVDASRPFASLAEFKALEQQAREGSRGLWAEVSKR